MTRPPVFDIRRGPLLCHAHLLGDVNKPLVARCTVWHTNPDIAWSCLTREREQDRSGTLFHWTTCRPEFCADGRRARRL